MATGVNAVSMDWDGPKQRTIKSINYSDLVNYDFAEGSMGPKVKDAWQFVEKTGKVVVIGSLGELDQIAKGKAGTRVNSLVVEMELY
tara:strand:+ start:14098 stop:14358 length:261 start_codon:yes stop_codon:yes gene_type:complete